VYRKIEAMTTSAAYPKVPRWLKVSGVVVLVVLLHLAVVGHLAFGGRGLHGQHGNHATMPEHATHDHGDR
jgi:hypothetical protein